MAKLQRPWGSFHANYVNGEVHIALVEGGYLTAGAPINPDDARAIANMLNEVADKADRDKENQ